EREGTVPSCQVSQFYWEKKKHAPTISSFFICSSVVSFLSSLCERRIDGDSLLSVALLDGTTTALSVGLGDEGKPRWVLSLFEDGKKRRETATDGDISLYR
ncbi:unnamed protein product, partial [Brassica rapa]